MEACKLAATHVTPQVVKGLGSISRVNKSCHCAFWESTFHLAARACLQLFPQHSPWTHLPLISTPAQRTGSPPGLSSPSPRACMSRQTLLWAVRIVRSRLDYSHQTHYVLCFSTWWLSPCSFFAICALSVMHWRKNCWASPVSLLNLGAKFECFPKCTFPWVCYNAAHGNTVMQVQCVWHRKVTFVDPSCSFKSMMDMKSVMWCEYKNEMCYGAQMLLSPHKHPGIVE